MGGRGLISEQEINGSTVSNIFVAAASLQDTGNYTCEAPALAANTSVNLHVLVDGEWEIGSKNSVYFPKIDICGMLQIVL